MTRPPEPPPEGVLIESARRDARLSVREAARRAGISEGWWRQVARGYQSLSGGDFGPVRDVPAATIARMALAAGVSPGQMETEGQRPDAAQAMRSGEVRLSAPAAGRLPPDDSLPPVLRGLPPEIGPYLAQVDDDLAAAAAGDSDPFDDFEHDILRNPEFGIEGKRAMIAYGRMYRAQAASGQSRRSGLTAAPPAWAR